MSAKCGGCGKTVYTMEEIQGAGKKWHKGCFRCMDQECKISLDLRTVLAHDGKIYCAKHVPKPKATIIADDVMMQHARAAPSKASEGSGHVGLIHKDSRKQDTLEVHAGTLKEGQGGAEGGGDPPASES